VRSFLLLSILVGFGRLLWQLDAKDLWWDESLTLQRAESALWPLLRNELWIYDGFNKMLTIDQHPFFFFLLTKPLVMLAGNSHFVLRFVSVMAATLLMPMVWSWGRWLARQNLLPTSTAMWAVLAATSSPFFLWYGQEARPYALWALLALISTYALVRTAEAAQLDRFWLTIFVISEGMFVTTHYFAFFLLPVHALWLLLWLRNRSWRLALGLSIGGLTLAAAVSAWIGWGILARGGGINFRWVPLDILLRDLLNAFNMGPSAEVSIPAVLALDMGLGAIALLGALGAIRSWSALQRGGWLVGALVIVPIFMLIVVQTIQPVYMNARHLSLIGGGYLLTLGGGLAIIWRRQRWVAILAALFLVAGSLYSSNNYFTQEVYAKDDFSGLRAYLEDRILPGDVVLINPPFSWRHFAYYLPLDQIDLARQHGVKVAHYAVPLIGDDLSTAESSLTYRLLQDLAQQYNRIWFIRSGTHAYGAFDSQIQQWLEELTQYRLIQQTFFSHSTLRAELYYPIVPVANEPLLTIAHPINSHFGDQLRLIGYDVQPAMTAQSATPVALYWQIETKTDLRYKYILALEEAHNGAWQTVVQSEQEPFDGWIATDLWYPGQTFSELSSLPAKAGVDPVAGLAAGHYRLTLEVYGVDSLQKLPVTQADGSGVQAAGTKLILNPGRQ